MPSAARLASAAHGHTAALADASSANGRLDDDDDRVVTAASAAFGSNTVFAAQHAMSPALSHKANTAAASPLSPLSPLVSQPRPSPPSQPSHLPVTMAAQTFAHSALFTASKPQRSMVPAADADVVKYATIRSYTLQCNVSKCV